MKYCADSLFSYVFARARSFARWSQSRRGDGVEMRNIFTVILLMRHNRDVFRWWFIHESDSFLGQWFIFEKSRTINSNFKFREIREKKQNEIDFSMLVKSSMILCIVISH